MGKPKIVSEKREGDEVIVVISGINRIRALAQAIAASDVLGFDDPDYTLFTTSNLPEDVQHGELVELVLFSLNPQEVVGGFTLGMSGFVPNEQLVSEYERRGLVPADLYSFASLFEANHDFEGHLHGLMFSGKESSWKPVEDIATVWKDRNGNWCTCTGSGEEQVDPEQTHAKIGWYIWTDQPSPVWYSRFFAGVRK